MNRVSNISSEADFALEDRREDLRDRRWQRRRDKVRTIAWVIAAFCAGLSLPHVLLAPMRML